MGVEVDLGETFTNRDQVYSANVNGLDVSAGADHLLRRVAT